MVSEIASVFGVIGGASVAIMRAKRYPSSLRRQITYLVLASLLDLAVLGISGFFRESDSLLTIVHALAGHLMLPLVATAVGLWFGMSLPSAWRRPIRTFFQLLFLLVLALSCLSNTWTGYFGPSRNDPVLDRDNNIRFQVIHRWVVPIIIGIMLLFWLIRLVRSPTAVEESADH